MKLMTAYQKRARNRGQALVEFSLVVFTLVLVMVVILDFGRAVYSYSNVYNAAREGARYGSVRPTDCAGIEEAARRLAGGLDVDVDVPGCPSTTGTHITVTVTFEYAPATPILRPFMSSDTLTLRSTSVMKREDRY